MERQVLLSAQDGLVGADLTAAYSAVNGGSTFPGLVARFKKKEEVGKMTKSILKHKIQTLTGKNVKTIEEEMHYKPKDPNEPSMDVETMRRLASCLILLSNGELPHANGNGVVEEVIEETVPKPGRKRAPSNKAVLVDTEEEEEEVVVQPRPAKSSRRSLGTVLSSSVLQEKPMETTMKRGRKSIAAMPSPKPPSSPAPRLAAGKRRSASGSLLMTSCPSPASTAREREHLAVLEEEAAEVANPTPLMKEMMKKRQSMGTTNTKSPAKSPLKTRTDMILANSKERVKAPPSPGPRPDFQGKDGAKAFLVAGKPLEVKFSKLTRTLPLSAQFPGAHLTMVHTPAEWGPHEIYSMTTQLKKLNKEAGLGTFVLLVGTGLQNVHMNIEALGRHTKHTQFITFHRNDANTGQETGKLRETCSYFIVAYFFPGCELEKSVLPSKMVRDGFSTCFVTDSTVDLESSIVQCFSEPGEWLLDLAPGARQLSVAALERGRSAIALHAEAEPLEDLGNYLRTVALQNDSTYRDKDGVVLTLAS